MQRTIPAISGLRRTMVADAAQCGRSFNDVLNVMNALTRGKVSPCPNNLEMMSLLLDRLNMRSSLEKLRFVHVAGTKGKGTTSAYTSALLQAYGFKVGLFTSPHLTDIRERILVNNALLPKEVFAQYFFQLQDSLTELADSESQLSRDISSRTNFFRYIFMVSILVFLGESVDVVVVEVGMGGRIDATNIIKPEVSVITALGIDHTEILGDTVEQIALEKAGIMKPGVICYAAPQKDYPSTRKVLEAHGREVGAPVVFVGEETLPIRNWPRLAIGGDHAIEDSKLGLLAARRVAGIPPTLPLNEVERNVLLTMTFAGRSHVVPVDNGAGVTFYLDGAHTYESLTTATRWFLDESNARTRVADPRRVLLFYSSRDPYRVFKAFMPFVQHFCKVILTYVESPRVTRKMMPGDGGVDVPKKELAAMAECWKEMYPEIPCILFAQPFDSLQEIIDLAALAAADHEDASKPAQIFVTGSFFLLADVLNLMDARGANLQAVTG